MKHWQGIAEVPVGTGPKVVTIGKFDGIHLGHQALLKAARKAADERGIEAVAVTFDRHPDALLNPSNLKLPLIGECQKAELFDHNGMDAQLVLAFDEALAGLDPEEFVDMVLVTALNAQVVCVGEDFRFGVKGSGTVATLIQLGKQFGFEVAVVEPVLVDGKRVSSSLIRDLLDEGDVTTAEAMLGRRHQTVGMVEHGLKLGRQLGFPTANLSRESEGYLPLDGVYAGWLFSDGVRYPAALSVGINETIQAVPRLIEAHVLGTKDIDLYDKVVTVEYVRFLRRAAKFEGIEALIKAIGEDCDRIAEILSHEPAAQILK
jgi:riboflavin kinase/FMN adenylyltransferase